MGIFSGSIPWYTMMVLQKKVKLLERVDDTLGVIHTHAIAGSLGGILTGIFTHPKLFRLFAGANDDNKYIGLAYALQSNRASAGLHQIGIQLGAMLFIIILNIVVTSLICFLIKLVVPLRLSDEVMEAGDDTVHGEAAYAIWGDGEKFALSKHNQVYDCENLSSGAMRFRHEVQMTWTFINVLEGRTEN